VLPIDGCRSKGTFVGGSAVRGFSVPPLHHHRIPVPASLEGF